MTNAFDWKIGDQVVKIFANATDAIQSGRQGKVVHISGNMRAIYPLEILWDNGDIQCYKPDDIRLELVENNMYKDEWPDEFTES